MTKRGLDKTILKVLSTHSRPLCTKDIAEELKISWHTCERYLLRLQLIQKVEYFTIGKTHAWVIKK